MSNESTDTPVASKAEIINSIGAALSEQRKARGLTPEKVAQSLRIRASFIKAIDEGQWQELPGEVYARGFVFRYAQVVGLDGKKLLEPYLQMTVGEVNPVRTTTSHVQSPSEMPKSALVWVGVGLVALAGIIKVAISDHRVSRQVTSPAPVESAAVPVPQVTSTPTAAPHVAVPHTLGIFSPLPLWLSVKADTKAFEGFIPQGTTWSWKAEGVFNLRLGHTQEIAITFDGRPIVLQENQKRVTLPVEN